MHDCGRSQMFKANFALEHSFPNPCVKYTTVDFSTLMDQSAVVTSFTPARNPFLNYLYVKIEIFSVVNKHYG